MRQVNRKVSFNRIFFLKLLCIMLIMFSISTSYLVFNNRSFAYYAPDSNTTKVSVEIGTTNNFYFSFTAALNSIPDDTPATIYLHTDVTRSGPIIIGSKKNITINGKNQFTITRDNYGDGKWYDDTLFDVKAGGKLVLENINIDSNNDWILDKETYTEALKNNENIDLSKIIIPEPGGAIAKNYLVKNSGTLTIINSKIKNFYSEDKGLFSSLGASSTTLINTEIFHCATLSGGLVAHTQNSDTKFYVKENTSIANNFSGNDGGLFKVDSGSELILDSAIINDNFALDSNGYVVMVTGSNSTLTMNGGEITNNSSLSSDGKSGNGAIYLSLNGQLNMNGGKIHNNQGLETGGIATDDSKTVVNLNGGIVEKNKGTIGNNYKSDINLNSDLNIGDNFTINGNISLNGNLNNNGNINGNVIVNDNNSINGNGFVYGDVVKKSENQILVNIDYNGGIDNENKNKKVISVNINEKIQLPEITKNGYIFSGWYLDEALTQKLNDDKTDKNISLYAKWEKKKYKVIWYLNDDEKKEVEYYAGEKIKSLDIPSKIGYDFVKWDGLNDNHLMPEQDITFKAVWQIKTFNIKFETNGAAKMNDISCEYGSVINKPKNPDLKNKKFIGWYLDKELKTLYDFKTPVSSSFTLYAGFKDIEVNPDDKVNIIEGEVVENLVFNKDYQYKKSSGLNLKLDFPNELINFKEIIINNTILGSEYTVIDQNSIEIKKEYLDTLVSNNYKISLAFENGVFNVNLKVFEKEVLIETKKENNNIKIIIATFLLTISLIAIYLINKKR